MRQFLMAGAALATAWPCVPALAQDGPTRTGEPVVTGAGTEGPRSASQDAGSDESEVVIVLGQGAVRQGQSIAGTRIEGLPAGTSPIKLVQRLPGVQVSGADAFGAYEWAARINIRGFQQSQLGFTLDGVPLGDMSYANHNGLHISRALISENLGRADLTQGSGAIDVASSSNLAGALQFRSRDPQTGMGGTLALTGGSETMYRLFGRFETGTFGPLDTRAWIAMMDASTEKWKGEGEQNQQQWAFKVVQPVGAGDLTVYYNNSSRQEADYQDLSLGMIQRLGNDWDNFGSSRWALAVQVADIAHNRGDTGQPVTNAAAGLAYPAPITSADDAYFDAAGLRDDQLLYVSLDTTVTEYLDVRGQVYRHQNEGQGLWGTPYLVSPNATNPAATSNNAPLSIRTTEYDIDRTGVLGAFTLSLGSHTINGGFWTEFNDFQQFRRFYALNRATPQRSFQSFQRDPFFTQWGYAFETTTVQLYLQDTWQITERLKLNAGFKALRVENTVRTLTINNAPPVPGTTSDLNGTIKTDEGFLPQIGATYELSDSLELFASFAENTAAFPSVVGGVFGSRNQAVFEETRRTVQPESSQTYEAGLRFRSGPVQLGAAGYIVRFEDRLLAVSQGPGIVGNAAIVSNVGAVDTYGVELVGTWQITEALSVFGSYSFNRSTYQDDVRNRAGTLLANTADKRVVNTAEHLFFGEVEYDLGGFFATVSTNYIGDRYFTFTNSGGLVEGRWLADLSVGYRFSGSPLLDGLEVRANVSNLFDEDHVGTLGTNGFVNAGDSQTLVTGAPRQMFLTVRKTF